MPLVNWKYGSIFSVFQALVSSSFRNMQKATKIYIHLVLSDHSVLYAQTFGSLLQICVQFNVLHTCFCRSTAKMLVVLTKRGPVKFSCRPLSQSTWRLSDEEVSQTLPSRIQPQQGAVEKYKSHATLRQIQLAPLFPETHRYKDVWLVVLLFPFSFLKTSIFIFLNFFPEKILLHCILKINSLWIIVTASFIGPIFWWKWSRSQFG